MCLLEFYVHETPFTEFKDALNWLQAACNGSYGIIKLLPKHNSIIPMSLSYLIRSGFFPHSVGVVALWPFFMVWTHYVLVIIAVVDASRAALTQLFITQNPWQRLVRRMTRFFTTLKAEASCTALRDTCINLGYTWKQSCTNQVLYG